MTTIITAYDGSANAQDALALSRQLAELTGASIALARVHRADLPDAAPSSNIHGREAFLNRQDEQLLRAAASTLPNIQTTIHPLAGTTTASALNEFAAAVQAQLIVFGSAHDGAPDRVHPGSAARRLLQGGACAIAVAPVGWREHAQSDPAVITFADDDRNASAQLTAQSLATRGQATAVAHPDRREGLIVLGSRLSAHGAQVMISANCDQILRSASVPVIAVARDLPIDFAAAPSQRQPVQTTDLGGAEFERLRSARPAAQPSPSAAA